MASSAVSQSHVTKPLLGTKTRAIRVGQASRLFLGRRQSAVKLTQTALGEEWIYLATLKQVKWDAFMVFHVSSNIPMESLKFGHWLRDCLCWCSPSFDISMRAEVSTLRKVVMTGHKQPLMGRPGVLHTNVRIVNLSQSFGTDFSDPVLHQINTSSDPKQQSRISILPHLSGAVNPPSLHQMQPLLAQTHPHLEQPKKTGLRIKEPIKKERIRCATLQIGFDVNIQFFLGKHIQKSQWNHHLMSWVFC